jgi:transposase-like protein
MTVEELNHCPVCDSYQIEDTDTTIAGSTLYQDFMCHDCESIWSVEYSAIKLEVLFDNRKEE